MRQLKNVGLGLGALLLSAGCTHQVFSPPARHLPLEAPATVGAGRTAISGELGFGGEIFGPELVGGSVRLRRGLTEHLEVSGEVTLVQLDDEKAAADQDPNIYMARAGVKWAPAQTGQHLAFTGGVGGGAHTGGGFIAPEAGVIVGYENAYLVPFIGYQAGVSVPLGASEVDTSTTDQGVGTELHTPETTFSHRLTLGVRVPLRATGAALPGGFTVGWQQLWLHDLVSDEQIGIGGLGGGFEVGW